MNQIKKHRRPREGGNPCGAPLRLEEADFFYAFAEMAKGEGAFLGGKEIMDIRSIEQVPASPEHQGTVPVWWLYKPREMKQATLGGYLELVSEFEVMGGGEVHPHKHPTYEFYYVVTGRGIMTIEGESQEIRQGDLVKIPPDAVHSLRPVSPNASIRCLAFAVGLKDTPDVNYSSE